MFIVTNEKDEKNRISDEFEDYQAQVRRLLGAAVRKRCRHCNENFRPYFEPSYYGGNRIGHILRCSKCRTNHEY